jgi:hypothetical protein
MGKQVTPEAIEHLRDAVTHLMACWDSMREIEKEYDIEIESDDISMLTLFEGEMTTEILTETLTDILTAKGVDVCEQQ